MFTRNSRSASSADDPTAGGTVIGLEIAALLFVGFLWGAQFGLNKIQLETIPPFTGVAANVTVAPWQTGLGKAVIVTCGVTSGFTVIVMLLLTTDD